MTRRSTTMLRPTPGSMIRRGRRCWTITTPQRSSALSCPFEATHRMRSQLPDPSTSDQTLRQAPRPSALAFSFRVRAPQSHPRTQPSGLSTFHTMSMIVRVSRRHDALYARRPEIPRPPPGGHRSEDEIIHETGRQAHSPAGRPGPAAAPAYIYMSA